MAISAVLHICSALWGKVLHFVHQSNEITKQEQGWCVRVFCCVSEDWKVLFCLKALYVGFGFLAEGYGE